MGRLRPVTTDRRRPGAGIYWKFRNSSDFREGYIPEKRGIAPPLLNRCSVLERTASHHGEGDQFSDEDGLAILMVDVTLLPHQQQIDNDITPNYVIPPHSKCMVLNKALSPPLPAASSLRLRR